MLGKTLSSGWHTVTSVSTVDFLIIVLGFMATLSDQLLWLACPTCLVLLLLKKLLTPFVCVVVLLSVRRLFILHFVFELLLLLCEQFLFAFFTSESDNFFAFLLFCLELLPRRFFILLLILELSDLFGVDRPSNWFAHMPTA
jgi:hypothetical protein